MARSRFTGPVAGNYIVYRLVCRASVASGQSAVLRDLIPMTRDFRVVHVAFDAGGTTAAASAAVTSSGGTTNISGTVVVSSGTPKQVSGSTLATNLPGRTLLKGEALELRITTDGSGVAPAGSIVAFVTGYALRHTQPGGRWAESGQCRLGGPVAGFLADICLFNTTVVANAAEAAVCNWIAPWDGELMAISYDLRGATQTTGSITVRIKNTTSGNFMQSAVHDWDASNSAVIDAAGSSPALANRAFSRGDTISLMMAAGASDSVAIGQGSAHLFVWVKGHYDNTGVADTGDESLTNPIGSNSSFGGNIGGLRSGVSGQASLSGPVEGGMMIVPFLNKRAAQAAKRVEDALIMPVRIRVVDAAFGRSVTQTTTREMDKNGTQMTPASATQNIVSHNEGVTLPAPASVAGQVVAQGILAGEDTLNRNLDGGLRDAPSVPSPDILGLAMTGAGSAALNDTAHVTVCTRDQIYLLPSND